MFTISLTIYYAESLHLRLTACPCLNELIICLMPLPVGVNQVKQLAVFHAHFNRHKLKKKHNPGSIRTFTKEQEIHEARERRSEVENSSNQVNLSHSALFAHRE